MWDFKRLLNCEIVFANWTDEGKVFQRIKAQWRKKWTNFAKLAWHFPGSHHFSLKFVWEL